MDVALLVFSQVTTALRNSFDFCTDLVHGYCSRGAFSLLHLAIRSWVTLTPGRLPFTGTLLAQLSCSGAQDMPGCGWHSMAAPHLISLLVFSCDSQQSHLAVHLLMRPLLQIQHLKTQPEGV